MLRRLGKASIDVSPIGLGCWQFSGGKGLIGGFWEALPTSLVNEIVEVSLKSGVNWFDTAEAYGKGRSEAALSGALESAGKRDGDVVVATKWNPFFRTAKSIIRTFPERSTHLDGFSIDLHQVHMPTSLSSTRAQMDAMADLVESGKTKAVGVSNFSAAKMKAAYAALEKRGIPLASNQMKYSLLDRSVERNGVLESAKNLGVTVIAYSPLAQGLLTGRFHDDPASVRSRPGPRKWMPAFRRSGLERSRPVVEALRDIAAAHDATPSQVALSWLIHFHGDSVVAIPGASRVPQAEQNAKAMWLRLESDELARLDRLTRHGT